MRSLTVVLFVAAAAVLHAHQAPQEPQGPAAAARPAPPPSDAAPLAPVQEPWAAPVLRQDLLLRFDTPDSIEGFYRLQRRVQGGRPDVIPGDGWLVIGRRHMLLYLQAPGGQAEHPLLRAGVRQWRRAGHLVQLTVLAGHYNDSDGTILIEQNGTVEMREIVQLGTMLRVHQDQTSYLEFVRAE